VPNEADRTKWDCSPIFAPNELLAKTPSTWVAVMELDILRDEGLAYAERLRNAGVSVTHKLYKKAPHQILVMDGKLCLAFRKAVPYSINRPCAYGLTGLVVTLPGIGSC
jgi:acetyl esterase/lipase